MATQSGFVMLIGSDGVGRGDQELGQLLMQRFLHEFIGAEPKPGEMIFINHGVKLVAEDSPVLEQLRRLEAEGIEIRACSTCLDRFGLLDKVAVGFKTSMTDTVSTLAKAAKVVTV